MALIDKLKAIADGFRSSRGTTDELTLDDMAVLASEKVGGGESGENKLAKVIDRTATEVTASDLEGVTKIGNCAFYNAITMTSIEIPNSVTSIGDDAFSSCSSLTSVTIGNSVTSIGYYAFSGCSKLTSIIIPNSVTRIGYSAFYGCNSLTSIEIPNSTTYLGHSVFSGCSGLTSVTIGSGITDIKNALFSGCKNLTSITINAETAPTLSSQNAFGSVPASCIFYVKNLDSYNSTNWVAIRDQYIFVEIVEPSVGLAYTLNSDGASYSVSGIGTCTDTDIVIPDTYEGLAVTKIGTNAFDGKKSLTSVKIPNSVTSINGYAFRHCEGLASIDIPNSVTSIGIYAFSYCKSLTNIEIPESVTSIGYDAFSYCKLAKVTIPSGVTNIAGAMFRACPLESVTINTDTAPTLESTYAFLAVPTTCVFYVKNLDSYNSTNWVDIRDRYTFIEKE